MTGIRECILYRDFEQGELLEKMTMLMEDISHPKVLLRKGRGVFCMYSSAGRDGREPTGLRETCGMII